MAGVKLNSGRGDDEILWEVVITPFFVKPITGRKYRIKSITGSEDT
jgi:hypothetical protein